MFLSFVIPCYRSETTIEFVVNDILSLMKQHAEDQFEIILVNDGSPDQVMHVLIDLLKKHDCIKLIDLANNFGQANATYAGLNHSIGDFVIMLVDDGQTPIDQTYQMIHALGNDYDVVIADFNDKSNGFFRRIGSKLNDKMMQWVLNKPKDLMISDFWIMKKFISDELCKCKAPSIYMSGYLLRITNKITNVKMQGKKRISGKSGYSIGKLLSLWLAGFTAFSIKPLRLASAIGSLTAISGLLYGLFTIVKKIINPSILAGYASLISIILLIGGAILLMLGLIGEYIGRAYMCVNDNPQYVIRSYYDTHTMKEDEHNING